MKSFCMTRITFEIKKDSDLQLLLLLADRIGLKVLDPNEMLMSLHERQVYLDIIAGGGDTAYIEDPVRWQKEQREERDLPYRN